MEGGEGGPLVGLAQWQCGEWRDMGEGSGGGQSMPTIYAHHTCSYLWVDEQRPPPCFRHHDAVVNGEGVVGQPINGPVADLDGIPQHRHQPV